MITTNEHLETVERTHTIYTPPEALLATLAEMAVAESAGVRRALAAEAMHVHDRELNLALETGRARDIPATVTRPDIIGSETVSLLGVNRRVAGRTVVRHPTDPTKCLIVPL